MENQANGTIFLEGERVVNTRDFTRAYLWGDENGDSVAIPAGSAGIVVRVEDVLSVVVNFGADYPSESCLPDDLAHAAPAKIKPKRKQVKPTVNVVVFLRDGQYWIVPADRPVYGVIVERDSLKRVHAGQIDGFPLDLEFARLNASPIDMSEAEAVVARLNTTGGVSLVAVPICLPFAE